MPTKIPWTDETWNPIVGCSKVSPGCQNCYAERMAARFAWEPGPGNHDEAPESKPGPFYGVNEGGKWNGKVVLKESRLDQPLHWRKPRKVFVCSMGDLFHESVPDEWIQRVWGAMIGAERHTFQILTKRPERMRDFLDEWLCGGIYQARCKHIWLGVTMENQEHLWRVWNIMRIQTAVKFVSVEPCLSKIDFKKSLENHRWENGVPGGLNWVICGAETGPHKRKMDLDWARSLRDQCGEAGVPFFFKKDSDGNQTLDGKIHHEYPRV